jgi:hypothetical protein
MSTPTPVPAAPPMSNKARWLAVGAIVLGLGCPTLGIVFAYYFTHDLRRTNTRFGTFAYVTVGIVALSTLVWALLFAGDKLPFTGWLIPK